MADDEEVFALLGDGDDVLARVDASGRIESFVAGPSYVGRGERELLGHNLAKFLAPEDAERVLHAITEAIALGVPQVVEHRRPSPVGMRVVRARVVRSKNGGALAHLVDVTDAVGTRAALDETIERFQLLARATTDAVFDWNAVKDETRWTDSIRATFGFEQGIVTDQSWWIGRLHPDDRPRVIDAVTACSADKSKEVWEAEYRFRGANGDWFDVFNRGLLVRDASGKVVRVVGSMLDITEKKNLGRRLAAAERLSALGTFAAGLAHEVRNPLTAVTANIALASTLLEPQQDEPGFLPRVREALKDAEAGGARILGVVDGLHVFSDRARAPFPVDLAAVVKLALGVARPEVEQRAELDASLEEGHLVLGYADQLGQVVLNLLANARDAFNDREAASRGRVAVKLSHSDEQVILDVEDDGIGIDEAHLPHLFEPFFTTKPRGLGTGIGLAICREIVAAHGGTITALPQRPRGAVFRVTLPALRDRLSAAHVAPGPARRLRILFLDDDELTRKLVRRILEPDHDVVLAASADEAKRALEQDAPFDLILSDVNLGALRLAPTLPVLGRRRARLSPL